MRAVAALVLPLALCACGSIEFARYDPAHYEGGLVYARNEPYVLVSPPGKDGAQDLKVVGLPAELFTARAVGLFGTADLKPTIDATTGALTAIDAASDKTAPVEAALSALTSGAKLMAAPEAGAAATVTIDPAIEPGLYKFERSPLRLVGPLPIVPR